MIQRLIDANDIARWYSETHPVSIARANEMLVLDEIIKFMPSADVEVVKHAHWEMDEQGDCKCSACGEWQSYPDEYCRECGAKMTAKTKIKTAEEMFAELGYRKNCEADGTFVYMSGEGDIIIITKDFVRFTDIEEDFNFTISTDPFLPIAQKLKEMEEK